MILIKKIECTSILHNNERTNQKEEEINPKALLKTCHTNITKGRKGK
jgi:hypothetical protein